MPIQKGKKRRRTRRNGPLSQAQDAPIATASATPVKREARTAGKRRWQPPLWVNVLFGATMLGFGIYFTAQQHGANIWQRVMLFAAYCLVAGFYLFRAWRQLQTRRN